MRFLLVSLMIGFVLSGQVPDPAKVDALVTTDLGSFRISLAPDKAPRHVAQFLKLTKEGFYNGGAFHRVVAGGIVQGGDPLLKDPQTPRARWGTGGLNLIADEVSDLKHEAGTVSAVTIPGKANSGGTQFFICVNPQPSLDGKFSGFGTVTEGMEIVDQISRVEADEQGVAKVPVKILTVTLVPKRSEPFKETPVAELKRTVRLTTTLGQIRVQLEPDWAPETCRNFLKLSASGWLDGTVFHRLVNGFVVQGGTATGRQTPAGEPQPKHWADRYVRSLKGEFRDDLKHTRGMLSMARTDDPDSADTSFFMVLGNAPHLDGKYAIFGHVIEGMEVLDAFEKEAVDGETPVRRLELIRALVE